MKFEHILSCKMGSYKPDYRNPDVLIKNQICGYNSGIVQENGLIYHYDIEGYLGQLVGDNMQKREITSLGRRKPATNTTIETGEISFDEIQSAPADRRKKIKK